MSDPQSWYAVRTRSRQEKQVAAYLHKSGVHTYVPLRRTWSSRRDRKLTIEIPALPGYLFIRCALYAETRALVKRSSGVVGLVENAGRVAVIPPQQIDSLRVALEHSFNAEGHPVLKVGDRVRVVRGPMIGVEGYLTRVAENKHRLVIAVDYITMALSIEVDACCVEAVE